MPTCLYENYVPWRYPMKKLLLCLVIAAAAPLAAALSPAAQSIVEFKAVIDSPEVEAALGNAALRDIWRTGDRFFVLGYDVLLPVDIIYQPATGPGPQKFKLEFQKAVPLTTKD